MKYLFLSGNMIYFVNKYKIVVQILNQVSIFYMLFIYASYPAFIFQTTAQFRRQSNDLSEFSMSFL